MRDSFALHVERAASPHIAVLDGAGEGIDAPVLRVRWHDVHVMNESDRLLGAIPPETSVKICATSRFQLGGVEDLRGNSFAVEDALQVQRGLQLVAGRVCGIDAQVVGKDLHGLVTETIPVDRRRLLRAERDEGEY